MKNIVLYLMAGTMFLLAACEKRVTGVTLDLKEVTLVVGETLKLNATVIPENATEQKVYWRSERPEYLTVDSEGNITGASSGSARIRVSTMAGEYEDWCYVTVENRKNFSFTENFDTGGGSLSGWTFVNVSQTNKWYIGTATAKSGSSSCYISDNSYSNSYNTSSSTVHFYRDFDFVSTVENPARISFYWKGMGRYEVNNYYNNSSYSYAYLSVHIVEPSVTPVAGTVLSDPIVRLYGSSSWQQYEMTMPAMSGSSRLVFTWHNSSSSSSSYSSSNNPPAAVDNIVVTNVVQ